MTEVCVAMIVRNAEDTLPACLESIRPHVDHLVIVDTGSTDKSPEIAKLYANRWERWTDCNIDPRTGQLSDLMWDFAAARNKSFELVPDGMAAAWFDSDDIIVGAEHLRRLASELPDGPGACLLPYEYSYADTACTLPTCIHWRERLIKEPAAFHWMTPCHEVCVPRAGMGPHTQSGDVVIKHRAQQSKNPREPQRNLRILTAYLQRVGEGDPRAMYYCGVEYARHGMFGKAREILRRYVEIGNWTDEKCLAELELARILLQEGDCKQALEWADRALNTKSWPDPYWLKAKTFWRMAIEGSDANQEYNLRRAHTWAERGRPLEDAQTVLFYNPMERFETERIVNRIAAHFGKVDEAAEACRRGLKGMPGDPELFEQLKGYEAVLIGREMDTLLGRLVHLGRVGPPGRSPEYAAAVIEAIESLIHGRIVLPGNDTAPAPGPNPFARIGTGSAVDTEALPAVPEGKLDIVIFTGPAFEDWTPATIAETGIGGSETMAWEMARGLARLGHRVRHYGWCKLEQEGVYGGVYWLDSSRYRDIKCDVLVVSRYADGVQCVGGVKARARVAWVHDVHMGAALTPEHTGRFDRFLCLSEWHKAFFCETYAFIDPERVQVTRNGIDLGLFENIPDAGYVYGETKWEGDLTRETYAHSLYFNPGLSELVQVKQWAIPDHPIVVGASVLDAAHWQRMKERDGVTGCINVEVEHSDADKMEPFELCEEQFPDDGTAIDAGKLERIYQFAWNVLQKGGRLYVHCQMGGSRSPSIAYQILRSCRGLSPEDALAAVNRGFAYRKEAGGEYGHHPVHQTYMASVEKWWTGRSVRRSPLRAVYSSSPDRGLQTALDLWPLVRAEVPDAELHVFYGFDGLRKVQPALADALEAKANATAGVVLHGRVHPKELATEFLRSGVWFYPTWFSETSCITAMQAQAAGLRIVTSPIAALNETVGHRGVLIDGAPGPIDMQTQGFVLSEPSASYRSACVAAVVKALTAPDGQGESEALQYAAKRSFALPELCDDWSRMLTELVASVDSERVSRFYVAPEFEKAGREADEGEAA